MEDSKLFAISSIEKTSLNEIFEYEINEILKFCLNFLLNDHKILIFRVDFLTMTLLEEIVSKRGTTRNLPDFQDLSGILKN